MNFPNRRFSSPSIREYQTSKGDSGPRKKRPEPKPILHEPKVFPQSTSCPNQNHCKDHGLIVSAHHENTDRAVYWTVPHASGKELWLKPWPNDLSNRTGACLSRPTSHFKTYGRTRIHIGRAGRSDIYLGELDELSELSDTTLELDELSELSHTMLELNELSNTEDGAGSAAGRNEPFQPKEKTPLSFLVRLSPNFDPSFVGPVRHIRQRSKSGSIKRSFRSLLCHHSSHPVLLWSSYPFLINPVECSFLRVFHQWPRAVEIWCGADSNSGHLGIHGTP
ncbi:hypothetical protein DY000_02017474 [Brassica cretica]|uniref:Uncharacterized protein n=1 Tax=Brassica cretica TaxID=69181 RepID=A0ABQ7D1I9_BRACR|nr:hypothetical protein DY000_02017474 [Brassica cretica]